MKKFVMGLILGAGLAFTVSVQAEEIKSFIGSTIEGQFPVKVEGEIISAPGIVVNGTSYLPTRTIAEIAGYDVAFDADLGISLTGKQTQAAVQPEEVENVSTEAAVVIDQEQIKNRIVGINDKIDRLINTRIRFAKAIIDDPRSSEDGKEAARQEILMYEAEIATLEAEKATLEAQLNGASQ